MLKALFSKLTGARSARASGLLVLLSLMALAPSSALAQTGSIAGSVTDATTGAPIQNVSVTLRRLVGTQITFAGGATTNASGAFTVPGLAPGVYYALTATAAFVGYTNEIFDNILCPGSCSATTAVNSGAPITVSAGATTGSINFALGAGGSITGTILNAQTSAPLQGVNVQATTRIGLQVTFFGQALTDASGVYTIGGLPTGTYYLFTSTNLASNEIYNNLPCSGFCATNAVNTGVPVAVTLGNTTSGKDFQLDPGGSVSGTITDALSSAPLSNVSVWMVRQVGTSTSFVQSGSTNASGFYSVGGLPTGNYFAVAFPSSTYVSEIFGGLQCFSCQGAEILAGTPISVTDGATTTGRNFALDLAGTITGTVTSSATSSPLANVTVVLPIDANNSFGFGTDAAGVFTIAGLPTGSYRLATSVGQYANEAYNNIICPGGFCSNSFIAASGTPIGVTGGATTSGINFALDPLSAAPGSPFALSAASSGGGVQITWSAPTSGGAATSYILDAGLAPGTTAVSFPSATPSLFVPGVPPGTYFLRVSPHYS